jgi:ABC-type multidrug transport system permease subunit
VILVLIGIYLMVNVRSFFNPRSYSYISETGRWRRVIRSGMGAIAFIFGLLFIMLTSTTQAVTLGDVFSILAIGACLAPVTAFLTGLRAYRDLWTFTKTEDDVVFLDEDKDPKN